MKSFFLPSADSPALEWLGLIAFLLVCCLCVGGVVIWMKLGKNSPFKRKRKHRHRRPLNPTLAQTGGLPPKRNPNQPPPGT